MSKLIRTYHHGVLALLIGAAVAVPLKGRAEALILQGEEAELHGTFVSSKYTGYTGQNNPVIEKMIVLLLKF